MNLRTHLTLMLAQTSTSSNRKTFLSFDFRTCPRSPYTVSIRVSQRMREPCSKFSCYKVHGNMMRGGGGGEGQRRKPRMSESICSVRHHHGDPHNLHPIYTRLCTCEWCVTAPWCRDSSSRVQSAGDRTHTAPLMSRSKRKQHSRRRFSLLSEPQ